MKLGLIADIHGNLQALEAVLEALGREGVDLVLCAGDLVAYGANPNAVIGRLRDEGIPSVTGNYDDAAAWGRPTASEKRSSPLTEPLKQAALAWTQGVLRDDHRRYLKGLPWQLDYRLDGQKLSLLHAGLSALDAWVTPDTPDALGLLAETIQADVVVLGHTHQAFTCRHGGTLFINPGAVGRALDGDPRAAYAILELDTLSVTHHRVTYNLEGAVAAIQRSDMPSGIAQLVRHAARRIEEVTDDPELAKFH